MHACMSVNLRMHGHGHAHIVGAEPLVQHIQSQDPGTDKARGKSAEEW
jgi:hypothetical protein